MKRRPSRVGRAGWATLARLLLSFGIGHGSMLAAVDLREVGLRRSHVALMPEGEPESIDVLRPLRAGIMAWGVDAVGYLDRPALLQARMEAYREIGVGLRACNVWMLTATPRVMHDDPELREAVCRDIEGAPIVPRWLDGEYHGVKSYWGCTNHPRFRAQLIERVRAGIAAGANLLHLDDHMGTAAAADHSGGCFCEACMVRFAAWRRRQGFSGSTDEAEVNYRELLHQRGLTTREAYEAALREDRVPWRDEFLRFQREAAAAFVEELGRVAAETAGRSVPIGVNAWNLAPTQLATAHVADYFANEVSHYGVEDLTPPRAYLLADALRMPVFSTGTGEDWIEVMQHGDVARVQRWIALAHAFGHHFMYAYRKWGFSAATGTQWYETPIETYAPVFDFITGHPELFDDLEAAPQVGVLYDNDATRTGTVDIEPILRDLHDAHFSPGLVVAGDAWFQHRLDETSLAQFDVVIVPDGVTLDAEQNAVLETFRQRGRVIPWRGTDDLRSRITPWLEVSADGRVWALPRERKGSSKGPRGVIHLLNLRSVDKQLITPVEGAIRVSLLRHETTPPLTRATWHAVAQEAQEVSLTVVDGRYVVEVPGVELWGILALE